MSFFFSKKVFRCHSCNPATDKQTKSESKLNHAIFVFVLLFRSCISSSLPLYIVQNFKTNKENNHMCRAVKYIGSGRGRKLWYKMGPKTSNLNSQNRRMEWGQRSRTHFYIGGLIYLSRR